MLHSLKRQSILQWYNSLTSNMVNSLEELKDGSYLHEIVSSLQSILSQGSKEGNLAAESIISSETSFGYKKEVITSVKEEAADGKMKRSVSESVNADSFVIKESDQTDTQKKYDAIKKYIDDFYHVESSSLIDYGECQKGVELELAKVAIFLLFAKVQNSLSLDDNKIKHLAFLEWQAQENICECMEFVLFENELQKSELHKVLSQAKSWIADTHFRKQSSRNNPVINDLSEGVSRKRKIRPYPFYDDIQSSPFAQLLESPKMQGKADILRRGMLNKLRSALHAAEKKIIDLTFEKQNLNHELEERKRELEFCKKELESHREEQEKLKVEVLKDKKIKVEKS